MPLTPRDQSKILKNYRKIVDELTLDNLLDSLVSKEVLTLDDEEKISNKYTNPTQKDKNKVFIRCLLNGPQSGYGYFIEELKRDAKAYGGLADTIEKTEVQESKQDQKPTIDRWIGTEGLSSEIAGKQLNDLHLLHFSKAIRPGNLKMIAHFFGIPPERVDCIEYKNLRSPEAACHDFILTWRDRVGNKATVDSIVRIFFDAWLNTPDSIFEQKVLDAIKEIN